MKQHYSNAQLQQQVDEQNEVVNKRSKVIIIIITTITITITIWKWKKKMKMMKIMAMLL